MVGSGEAKKGSDKMDSIDLIQEMSTMTKAEMYVINVIKDNTVWNFDEDTKQHYSLGLAYLHPGKVFKTASDKRRFQKGMKILHSKDLAVKVGKDTYMMNPQALIPSRPMKALELYESLAVVPKGK